MAFAQKPSILPSSSAFAAATPNETPGSCVPGTPTIRTPSRARSMPEIDQELLQPQLDHGGGADHPPFHRVDVARRRREVGAQHQEPVHALRQRREQLAALPLREGAQRDVRGSGHEIDPAVAQRLVGLVVREDELVRGVEPLLP